MRILLISGLILSILSCSSLGEKPTSKDDKDMLKCEDKSEQKMEKLSHVDYNVIFESDSVENTPIELLNIGTLNVPSGQIVVCDPLAHPSTPPLERTVDPGIYPVKIYIAKTEEAGDRYAIAKLEFSKNKAVKWVMALQVGDDITELSNELEYFGFPVDAGLGGFFDYQSGKEYQKFESDFIKANPEGNIYDDFFAAEFKKNAKVQNDSNDVGDWINFRLPSSELNISMFHSGYGDGFYPSYWGIDQNGKVVSLVIDFLVLLVPEER
ncbi:MAG: DUF4241 domain-containing protein [Bacteroidota bacterium]